MKKVTENQIKCSSLIFQEKITFNSLKLKTDNIHHLLTKVETLQEAGVYNDDESGSSSMDITFGGIDPNFTGDNKIRICGGSTEPVTKAMINAGLLALAEELSGELEDLQATLADSLLLNTED